MRNIVLLLCLFSLSCSNEKVLQLPEIKNAKVTEVLDVSPAYIFYDETQPDSTEFNRKNLISTTNWLVNIDKRLTLKQVLPHLQYLQNKRRKASIHKNENAKNYFTCNETSIKNLGFLEFTDVEYHSSSKREDLLNYCIKKQPTLLIETYQNKKTKVFELYAGKIETLNAAKFEKVTSEIFKKYGRLILAFDSNIDFSNYITTKSKFKNIESVYFTISSNEFFY